MGLTKRQFIVAAFEELGLASYVFDLQPQDLQSALLRLDSLLAQWNGKGIRLNYPAPSTPESSDMDDATGIPDYANEAVYKSLAISMAPSWGKMVGPELKTGATEAYNTMISRATIVPEMTMPKDTPRGAGYKTWREQKDNTFTGTTDKGLQIGPDAFLENL